MSSVKIQERFVVGASPDEVWAFLMDPAKVVTCLPGAALTASSEDGRSHEGTVKVKTGPVTVVYKGAADFVELDAGARRLRMEAKGREKAGSGTVGMNMESSVLTHAQGAELVVDAEVELTGRLVSFGRGMIDAVVQEILQDFVGCLAGRVGQGAPSPDNGRNAAGEPTPDAAGVSPDDDGGRTTPGQAPPPAGGLGLLFRAFRRWLRSVLGGG
jgi:carbon monoxide dehydrogenase subunit G